MTAPLLIHVTSADISLELLLGRQLLAYQRAGYEVVGASAPGPYADRLSAAGIEHVPLAHATRAMAPHRDVAAAAELYRLFRSRRPTIVHTHNPKPGFYGRLAARAARVPVIVNTVHGLYATPDDSRARRGLVYGLERVAATCSHVELLQNPEDVPVLRRWRVPDTHIQLLGNGIDLTRFRPHHPAAARAALVAEFDLPDDAAVVGAVGRLVWEKGYRELFEAMAKLHTTHPHAHLVVAGPSEPEKTDAVSPTDQAHAARAANIHFAGERHDIEKLYPAFDLYVLASHREGFPRSAMEAAACRLAVVATDIRGCRQVVEHETTGLLVPPRHSAALAAAIGRLVDTPDERAAMGRAGAAKAQREFDEQTVIDLTLATYDRLIQR